ALFGQAEFRSRSGGLHSERPWTCFAGDLLEGSPKGYLLTRRVQPKVSWKHFRGQLIISIKGWDRHRNERITYDALGCRAQTATIVSGTTYTFSATYETNDPARHAGFRRQHHQRRQAIRQPRARAEAEPAVFCQRHAAVDQLHVR